MKEKPASVNWRVCLALIPSIHHLGCAQSHNELARSADVGSGHAGRRCSRVRQLDEMIGDK
jgi:hypothetical protein